MIKLEHVVLPSPEQMEFAIEGMRNPMNSWDKSDSNLCKNYSKCGDCLADGTDRCVADNIYDGFALGENDLSLMQKLSKAGTDHRKFMRMMPVMVRITAPLYWWKEFDTYKVGTVANSCSTMHRIQAKEFTLEDFSTDHLTPQSLELLENTIILLNKHRALYNCKTDQRVSHYTIMTDECYANYKKDIWWQMIQLLPSSYNQTHNVMLNYEVLANIYKSRKNHKLDEWVQFCEWIETLPYSELFTREEK